jgi:DNA repair exonuclease SbcCD ATPase subunit
VDPSAAEEEKWRGVARDTRQRVADAQDRVARLEGETKKLENDFYSWDDGLYRDNVIKPAWDKKREELETARRDLEAAEKDLADLPEKARKAGALPGWIRE